MIEENTIGGEDAVGVAVILHNVVGVNFGCRVRAAGLKQRLFVLRRGAAPNISLEEA